MVLSVSVLLTTSVWFSGTAATASLMQSWKLTPASASSLTISVQLGFIAGTLLYSLLNLADVFNPRRVFFVSALAAALFNGAFALFSTGLTSAFVLRFLMGIFLAGVYPVGMKIMATWFERGLGWRLGVLVGALTVGTALPFLIRAVGTSFGTGEGWRLLVGVASGLAVVGGLLVLLAMKDGPHLSGKAKFDVRMLVRVFAGRPFRLTAFGYFGHMWELYAFWALVSSWLTASFSAHHESTNTDLLAFLVIAMGSLGCALGGLISRRTGERRVAAVSLAVSASCCLLSGFAFDLPTWALVPMLLVWGFFVVSDSPQFSALGARYAPRQYVGTALTVQNGVGFAITIGSLQLVPFLAQELGWQWSFLVLAPGPLLGWLALRQLHALEREAQLSSASAR